MSKWTPDQVNAARAAWREQHPEDAEKRAQKRKQRKEPIYPELYREDMAESEDVAPKQMSPAEVVKVKKEMTALYRQMYDKRQCYLDDGDLTKAELSKRQKAQFKEFILHFEGLREFSRETYSLLTEGLKYPEANKELAEFCFEYLDSEYKKGKAPSLTLWLQIWNRNFVPMKAVYLMLSWDRDRGTGYKRDCFVPLWPCLRQHVINARDGEQQQLDTYREKNQIDGNTARRLIYFQLLIERYDNAN